MDKAYLKRASTVAKVIFGNVFYAFVIKLFLLPGNLMTGGTTGIGLVVKHFTGASISGFVLAFNIVMLIVGVIFLGKKFALTTILSSFTYPIALEAANHIFGDLVITDNPMLNTIFAGLGIGIGLGIVIRTGASTGGMDIPPLILNKYFRIPVSVSLNVFDILILLPQILYNPPERFIRNFTGNDLHDSAGQSVSDGKYQDGSEDYQQTGGRSTSGNSCAGRQRRDDAVWGRRLQTRTKADCIEYCV